MIQPAPPPFLLEVQTERLVALIRALEHEGLQLVSKPGRYVLRDQEQQAEPS